MQRQENAAAGAAWTVIMPVKPLIRAKSRLSPSADEQLRQDLALAFARDTVRAALDCPAVRDVAVVTSDPLVARELSTLGAGVIAEATTGRGAHPGDGLNAALAHGATVIRTVRPQAAIATLNADLPALRPAELAQVLSVAQRFPRAFLADADGIGTTLLSARPGILLAPDFGGASRVRHAASGAVEITLTGVESVRRDVDTEDDLRAALELGVGPDTTRCTASFPRSS